MILGHLTVTYVAGKQLEKAYPFLARTPALIFGAFLPDLIDKPLAFLFGTPGRGPFHSALVLSLLFLALATLFPRRGRVILTVGAGAFLHLLEDIADPAVVFWPLLGAWPHVPATGFFQKLSDYYLHRKFPYQLAIEAVSYPFFVWLLMKRKGSPQEVNGTEDAVNPHKE
jgi:hypothetical protein